MVCQPVITEKEINTLKKHLQGGNLIVVATYLKDKKLKLAQVHLYYKKGTIDKIGCNKAVINIEAMNISLVLNKSVIAA